MNESYTYMSLAQNPKDYGLSKVEAQLAKRMDNLAVEALAQKHEKRLKKKRLKRSNANKSERFAVRDQKVEFKEQSKN